MTSPALTAVPFSAVVRHMPRSITQPFTMGVRQDGARDTQILLREHWLMAGAVGTGLTNMIHTVMANAAGCTDVIVWGADLSMGRRLAPWMPRLDWIATTDDEADEQVRALVSLIDYRIAALGSEQTRIWQPSTKAPAIVYVVPEGAELVTGSRRAAEHNNRLELIASVGRAAAVSLVYATHYRGGERTPCRYWDQACTRFLMHVTDRATEREVLGPAVDQVNLSDLALPGTYFKADRMHDLVLARSPQMCLYPRDIPAQLAKTGAKTAPALDPGSAEACGQAYATRADRIPNHLRHA